MSKADEDQPHVENAWATLNSLRAGNFVQDVADALAKIADAVVNGQPKTKGSLTVTINCIKPSDEPYVAFDVAIDTKLPKDPGSGGQIFFSVDGVLTKHDPRRIELPFKAVDTGAGEVRNVDTETGEIREAGQ